MKSPAYTRFERLIPTSRDHHLETSVLRKIMSGMNTNATSMMEVGFLTHQRSGKLGERDASLVLSCRSGSPSPPPSPAGPASSCVTKSCLAVQRAAVTEAANPANLALHEVSLRRGLIPEAMATAAMPCASVPSLLTPGLKPGTRAMLLQVRRLIVNHHIVTPAAVADNLMTPGLSRPYPHLLSVTPHCNSGWSTAATQSPRRIPMLSAVRIAGTWCRTCETA